ncbi:MAG: hypothetical protein GC187_04170 [Alphaproteobacteria bacterium]|nr:hypothetical protein [Alphaproteobacteria bacterium]
MPPSNGSHARVTALTPRFAALTGLALALCTLIPAAPASALGAAASPAPGELYRQGIIAHVSGDHEAARRAFATDCQAGSAASCLQLAMMLADGEGGPAEPERARTMLSQACTAGGPGVGACHRVGLMRLNGEGGAADLPGARAAFNAACEADEPHACYDYAAMMIRGQGGARDPVDALVPLQKACDWDHPAGCYMLGLVTRESYGSLRIDVIRTAFQRACALGDARGCDAPLTSQ